jgi:hypothetical protein
MGCDPVYGAPKHIRIIFWSCAFFVMGLVWLGSLPIRFCGFVKKKLTRWYYQSKLFQWYGDPDMVRRYNFLRKKNGSSKTHT